MHNIQRLKINWGSFRGRGEEKWGSFWGLYHFGGCTYRMSPDPPRLGHLQRVNFSSPRTYSNVAQPSPLAFSARSASFPRPALNLYKGCTPLP